MDIFSIAALFLHNKCLLQVPDVITPIGLSNMYKNIYSISSIRLYLSLTIQENCPSFFLAVRES